MVLEAPNGYTSRAYYGTDTRAQALLVGAALAIGLTLWRERTSRPWFTRAASVLALAGVAGTAVLWATTSETSTFAFSGGFMLASLAAGGVVLGCAVAPRSVVVRLLELPPLPQLGRISYGIYLWYWPVVLVMSGQRLHWGPYPLFVARVAVTSAIAAVSYELLEMPIRRGALRRWRSWVAAPVGAAIAISTVCISMLVPVGAAELQGTQLAVTAPSSVKAPPAEAATLAGSLSSVPTLPGTRVMDTAAPTTTTTTTVPPFLSPVVPAANSSKPVKVLLVGDSVAGSLGVGLAAEAQPYDVEIVNEGSPACSVSMESAIRVLWYTVSPDPPCDVDGNPNSLFDTWRSWVDAYNPDVVIYVARGETFDQEVGGQWQNVGQPGFDSYLANRYRQAVSVLGSKGASVVLLTTPYYSSGTSPSGAPWPEDAPTRWRRTMRPSGRSPPRCPRRAAEAGSTCSISTRSSRPVARTHRPSTRSACAATTGCISRARAGSTSVSDWPLSWRPWARAMPRRRRVAHGRGLCHHRLRHGTRACPASSPARHAGRRDRHGRATGADLLRRPGGLSHLP